MTLSETRKLGIEFERRVQTMIPEKEYLDKLDTETIYAYLNSYLDKYIHDIYRNLDQIKSGSKMSAHVEAVLLEMLRTQTVGVDVAKDYTGDITDTNGLVIVENGRSVTYPLDPSFYMYVRSVSNVTSTYSFKSNEPNNGKQRPIRVLPNELVSQSDVWRLLETPHNTLRILRYPAASIGAYEEFDSELIGNNGENSQKLTDNFSKSDISFSGDNGIKVWSSLFEYDTIDPIWYDSRSEEIHFSVPQNLLPSDFYTNSNQYFVVVNENRQNLSESDISTIQETADTYGFEQLEKDQDSNVYNLSIYTLNKFNDSNNQIRLSIYKTYNNLRIGKQFFKSEPNLTNKTLLEVYSGIRYYVSDINAIAGDDTIPSEIVVGNSYDITEIGTAFGVESIVQHLNNLKNAQEYIYTNEEGSTITFIKRVPNLNADTIYIYVDNVRYKGEYVSSEFTENQYVIRIQQDDMSKPFAINISNLNKISITEGGSTVNLPTLNVIYDQYTTPVGIKIIYYAQPQRFDLMTSTRCELPMDAFDDLVTGAVDLYIQYVAGAEANKRRIEQARQQAAKQALQDNRRNSDDEE